MKTKKANKTLVWELERYRKALPPPEEEYGQLPSKRELSSARSSRPASRPQSQWRRTADVEQRTLSPSASPVSRLQEDRDIKAIMDVDHSPVEEEIEIDTTNEPQALMRYNSSKEDSNFLRSLQEAESKNTYTQEEIDEIIEENNRLRQNEFKYQDIINSLKDKLKMQKRKTTEANSDKVNYFAHKNDLEDFFLNCIEEVKKDISKRKNMADSFSQKKLNRSSSEVIGKSGGILKNKNVKGPKLEQFTKTDKKKVIELLISNEQVLLFLYEQLFPYQNPRPQSVKTLNAQKDRPMSSRPTLTTAHSFVPPYLLGSQPSARFVMEDGTSITTPSKMDNRFLPNQAIRAKTAQSNQRQKVGSDQKYTSSGTNLFKNIRIPFAGDASTSSLLENSRQRHLDYSNHMLNRKLMMSPSEDYNMGSVRQDPILNPNYSVQNNIHNLNLNINLQDPLNTKQFVPPKASTMKRTSTAPGVPRSVSMKQFTRLKTSKPKKRLKITARNK